MTASILLSGISNLYGVLKRDIDRKNTTLAQRQRLAKDLRDCCVRWTEILIETFDTAREHWSAGERGAAISAIEAQQADFTKIDYRCTHESSPTLVFLREDPRFRAYALAVGRFYDSALDLKEWVHGQFAQVPETQGEQDRNWVKTVVAEWRRRLEAMLNRVRHEYLAVEALPPE